jgi:hypothetical protein
MSTRAVRAEIALQNLDPRKPHNKVDKQGRLVPHGAGPGPVPEVVTIAAPELVKVKNALVQLEEVEETKAEVETEVSPAEVVEETKVDVVVTEETEEAPKKKPGGKKEKKVVSTDP